MRKVALRKANFGGSEAPAPLFLGELSGRSGKKIDIQGENSDKIKFLKYLRCQESVLCESSKYD